MTCRAGLAVLAASCLMGPACSRSPAPGDGVPEHGSVAGDGRYLLAGGDHTALVDLADWHGAGAPSRPDAQAVGCDTGGGIALALRRPAMAREDAGRSGLGRR